MEVKREVVVRQQECKCSETHLSKPHTVPLIGGLLSLGSIYQLEAGLILLMEISILTAASKLR